MKMLGIVTTTVSAISLSAAAAPADEPIQPISPVKEINLAQAELGKKLYFNTQAFQVRIHLLQFLSQPQHGGHRQSENLDR